MSETSGKNIPTPCAGVGATYGAYESKTYCGHCGTELIENPNTLAFTSTASSLWCPKCQCYPSSVTIGIGVSPMLQMAPMVAISEAEHSQLKEEIEKGKCAIRENCELRQEIEFLKAKKEVYRKHWLGLCDRIIAEIDKDGWCRLSMTKEEAIEMKQIFEELK